VAGTLILCAGPIGNLGDAPPRLGTALASAHIVYAEDTRRARILLGHLGVERPVRSFFAGNEARRAAEIGTRLVRGEVVALLTDAGTPGISDPGLAAVRAALDAGATVTGVPGPSAVTLALAVSGLPAERFVFEGFLPRRGGRRTARLADLAGDSRTAVLFCAPGRLATDLADLVATMGGERTVAVCRELTKVYEEVWRGTLAQAAAHWAAVEARGEVTVVVGGGEPARPGLDEAVEMARGRIGAGETASAASRAAAADTGVPRRQIYDAITRPDGEG